MIPIPAHLARCPTQGGRIVPVVSARHTNGAALFSLNHPLRRDACLRRRLCGVCGQMLAARAEDKFVVVVRPVDLTHGYTAEPALHPECAAYAARACPMLAGTMDHYRSTPRDLDAERCSDPGCDCRKWQNSDDVHARAGAAASPFYAAWIAGRGYRLRYDSAGDRLLGVAVGQYAALRLITPGCPDMLDQMRLLALGLPWHPPGKLA